MLYIMDGSTRDLKTKSYGWHVGETLPKLTAEMVTFQASGDELKVIMKALRETRKKEGK